VGAKADVTLLDLTSPHFQPTYHLMSNVVYAAGADDVTDVFVDGRHVLQNREAVTIDVERLRFEVRKIEDILRMS
jgi:5-methylthioadenosine/S-adenosylhomocysteine deaminase